jgi:hypothetical protein
MNKHEDNIINKVLLPNLSTIIPKKGVMIAEKR